MKSSKYISICGLCIFFAILFQIFPVLFSELFMFITVFSTIPIYIISRLKPRLGIGALIISGVVILFFSINQGLFFFFVHGSIGISLGVGGYYFNSKSIVTGASGLFLASTLSILNFGLNLSIFGSGIPGSTIIQIIIIIAFSLVYSFMYLNLLDYSFEIFNSLFNVD